MGDEPDILESFFAQFNATASELAGALHEAVASGDPGRVRAIMHRLKTSCRFVGALRLAELCERLERFGNDGDLPAIAREVPAFEFGRAQLRTCIAEYLTRARTAEAGGVPWQR